LSPRHAIAALCLLALPLSACPEDPTDTTTSSTDTSSSSGPGCTLAYLGDSAKDIEVEAFYYGADETDHPIADGSNVDLVLPPQGGRVVFVGVRATNLDPCSATLTGALRDPDSNLVRFDTRTINLQPDASMDGWGRSAPAELASYANVPVCHNTWLSKDIYGNAFTLEITLVDRDGKTITKTFTVTPSCAEPEYEAECLCICKGGYVLGEPCDGAGGAGGGG
jgi:hypothetical protein